MSFGPLVSTDWLGQNLDAADLKIIDGSWRMPGNGAAIESYAKHHIPHAVFFDIDAIADQNTDLPHMLPSPAQFEMAMGAFGIRETDRVVVYDEKGIFSAARVWWTLLAMGHATVAVLDGGLPAWLRDGRPVTTEHTVIRPTTYRAAPVPARCAASDDVRRALADRSASIVDARPADRFDGTAPEPRAGLRSGHMPGARNLPFPQLLTEDGKYRSAAEIRHLFESSGVDLSQPIITSCGSGVTAAILSLALEVIGKHDHAVYDGSWADWGDERHDDATYPVATNSGAKPD